MKKMMIVVLSMFFSFNLMAEDAVKKGWDLAVKVDKANEGFVGETSTMEMVLINAYGDKVTRKMNGKTKEGSSDGDFSISEFLWPADVKGTKLLTHAHKKTSDDQWLYLPSLKRVKRISSRNKSGSFMGSEFSYEDLGSQEPEKFTHKFIADEKYNKRDVWKSERVPVEKNSGYSKQVVIIDKEYMGVVRIDYFDRKGDLLKVAIFDGYKKIYKNLYRPAKIHMKNIQTKKESIITWNNRKLGQKFSKDVFDSANLNDAF